MEVPETELLLVGLLTNFESQFPVSSLHIRPDLSMTLHLLLVGARVERRHSMGHRLPCLHDT